MKLNSTLMNMCNDTVIRYVIAGCIAAYMSYSGYKKKSLSAGGAYAAFFTGFVGFGASYRFGMILIMFYLTSSKLTKAGKNKKLQLEADYGITSQRGVSQVIGSSIFATLISLLFILLVNDDQGIHFSLLDFSSFAPLIGIWNNLNLNLFSGALNSFAHSKHDPTQQQFLCSMLNCLYIAHYACATADTWASEVGILATTPPRLVTSLFLRTVPPGTNGGMSLLGTVASGMGGLFISLVYICMEPSYWSHLYAVMLGNTNSYAYDGSLLSVGNLRDNVSVLLFGFFCGILGSLIDSVLGATCQLTLYSNERKCIVKKSDANMPGLGDVVRICGMDLLSNEAVNVLSIFLTMLVSIVVSPWFFVHSNDR